MMEKMMLNLNSLATMLFTCDLHAYKDAVLTFDEWINVEKNLKVHGLSGPGCLFGLNADELMDILDISEYTSYKIVQRMKTMNVFLKHIYEYEQKGIRIITKYDEEYPQILVKKMKKNAPTCLFVVGNLPVEFEGISLTGLQTVTKKEKGCIKRLVDKINNENKWLISNDCKGVDQEAFQYALHHHGHIISFLCEKMEDKNVIYNTNNFTNRIRGEISRNTNRLYQFAYMIIYIFIKKLIIFYLRDKRVDTEIIVKEYFLTFTFRV